jgi:opacity protein-like surface antigen
MSNFLNAQISVGGGLVYGTDIDNIGITVNGLYEIDDNWGAAPSFTYFLEKDYVNWSVLDLDGNYTFTEVEKIGKIYGLAGLSLMFWKVDFGQEYETIFDLKDNGTELGLNLGGGFKMEISESLILAPEIRYTIGDADYLRIGAKILFALN